MGCCLSSGEKTDREPLTQTKQNYSWEKRGEDNRLDRSQLIISKQVGAVVGRLPGQLNGRQFHIQDCETCRIFILDHTSTVTVHGCRECDIVLGPCGGRQCIPETVHVVAASQQFRVRDCKKCSVYLHCKSQPVIESSHRLKFGCFQAYYPELRDQFEAAELHPYHSQWSHIHNFTSQSGESDWSLAQETTPPIDPPTEGELSRCGLTFQRGQSVVPYSIGPLARPDTEGCVVVLVGEEKERRANEFILKIRDQLALVQTCHTALKEQEAQAFFGNHDSLLTKLKTGPCIIVEVAGDNCQQICVAAFAGVPDDTYHMSASVEEMEGERDALANFLMSSLTM